jgi:hypothetical protein
LLPLLHGLGDYSTNKSLEPALKMFSCNNNTMNQTQPLSIYTSECMQLWIFDSSLFDHEDTRQEFMSKTRCSKDNAPQCTREFKSRNWIPR